MARPMSMKKMGSPAWAGLAFLLVVLISVIFSSPVFAQTSVQQSGTGSGIRVEFSRIGDASHFEFEGTGSDRYKLERNDKGEVVLRIPNLDEASMRR